MTKNKMSFCFVCVGLLIFITTKTSYGADNVQHKTESKQEEPEIQLKSAVGIGGSAAPVVLLAETIKKDKVSSRFRLNWSFNIAGDGGLSTALYDRKKSTLKLFSTLEDILGKSYINYLYSNVTDEVIIQLAEKYRSDEDTINNLSFIEQLPNGKNLGGTYISYEQEKLMTNKASAKKQRANRRKK